MREYHIEEGHCILIEVRIFDLKGSSLGRLVSPEQLADGCTTLKDANFSLKGLDQSHRTIKAAANSRVDTHQLIYHSLTSRNNFIEALGRDVQWLMQQRLIDYSLLVGFADEKKDVHSGSGEAKNTEGLFKKAAKVVTIASHIAKISKVGDELPACLSACLPACLPA